MCDLHVEGLWALGGDSLSRYRSFISCMFFSMSVYHFIE